jgi:hypothetical protein
LSSTTDESRLTQDGVVDTAEPMVNVLADKSSVAVKSPVCGYRTVNWVVPTATGAVAGTTRRVVPDRPYWLVDVPHPSS